MGRKSGFLSLSLILFTLTNCSSSDKVRLKEIELKEKELELREKEIRIKESKQNNENFQEASISRTKNDLSNIRLLAKVN